MLAELADRLVGRWLEGFRSRHGLRNSNITHDSIWDVRVGESRFLHVGCGHSRKQHTVQGFMQDAWREIRLDANPAVEPDIVADMTHMPEVPDGAVNAIFSSHNIEHLYWHQVGEALSEFYRVIDDEGFLVITCPDLQAVAGLIAEDRLTDTAYVSPAGPVTPFDILYGMRSLVLPPNYFMAHRSGFTLRTLISAVQMAGFLDCYGIRREANLDIWLVAHKKRLTKDELKRLASDFLPELG